MTEWFLQDQPRCQSTIKTVISVETEDDAVVAAIHDGIRTFTPIFATPDSVDALIDALTAARTEVFGPRPVSGDPEVQSLRQRLEYATDGLAAISTALELNEPIEHGVQHAPPEDCVYAIQDLQKLSEQVHQLRQIEHNQDTIIAATRERLTSALAEIESLKTDRDDAIRAAEELRRELARVGKHWEQEVATFKRTCTDSMAESMAHSLDTMSRAIHTIAHVLEVPTPPTRR